MYELRLYHAADGRLPELIERIGFILPPFFDRHGFPPRLGQWRVTAGASLSVFAWLLHWPDGFAARAAAFSGLAADPEWQRIRTATNGPGEMVDHYDIRFLSPLWAWSPRPHRPATASLHELRTHAVMVGATGAAQKALSEVDLPLLEERGATVLHVFENQTGPATPGITLLLGWRDYSSRLSALDAHETHPDIRERRRGERQASGRHLLGPATSLLLQATRYGQPAGAGLPPMHHGFPDA